MGRITTIGKGHGYFQPDTMILKIEFFSKSKTNSEAINRVHTQCEEFLNSVAKANFNLENITLDDDEINHSDYDSESEFKVTRKITIKLPLSAKCNNAILKFLQRKNYSLTYSINYELSNKENIHEKLIEEAVNDSRKKAETLAHLTNETIKGIESIDRVSCLAKSVCIAETNEGLDLMALLDDCNDAINTPLSDLLEFSPKYEYEKIEIAWLT